MPGRPSLLADEPAARALYNRGTEIVGRGGCAGGNAQSGEGRESVPAEGGAADSPTRGGRESGAGKTDSSRIGEPKSVSNWLDRVNQAA